LDLLPIVREVGRIYLEPELAFDGVGWEGRIIQRVRPSMVLKDGETVVMGGLTQETTRQLPRKVPGLEGLPHLNDIVTLLENVPFVKSFLPPARFEESQEETAIILTVHVVKEN
jgi:Flp pilus assembly secretin CpaC